MAETSFSHISCRTEAGVLVVVFKDQRIQGADLGDTLRQELLDAVQNAGVDKVIIDFRNVQYLMTDAFRPLLSLHRKLHETRGRMIFCNMSPEIADVFVVTRLISPRRTATAPFESAADVAEALNRFRHHTSRPDGDVLVITVTEHRLQSDVADSLTQHLQATVAQAQAKKIALDLGEVEMIATACLRPLLGLRNAVHSKGGRLVICNLQPQVQEMLTVTRLTSSGGGGPVPLESAADLPSAIADLKR